MIYFLRKQNGTIKIGHTDLVNRRVRQLEGANGEPLKLLLAMEGSVALERIYHNHFKHCRRTGSEWFDPCPELIKFINEAAEDIRKTPADERQGFAFDIPKLELVG